MRAKINPHSFVRRLGGSQDLIQIEPKRIRSSERTKQLSRHLPAITSTSRLRTRWSISARHHRRLHGLANILVAELRVRNRVPDPRTLINHHTQVVCRLQPCRTLHPDAPVDRGRKEVPRLRQDLQDLQDRHKQKRNPAQRSPPKIR